MGKTLREITTPGIVDELIKAYADEKLAGYLYDFLADSVSGNLYPQLRSMLDETSKSEYEHASELADMIVKLGGSLISDPMTLEDMANFPAIIPPDQITLDVVCEILAESEANAIHVYSELTKKTLNTDPVVYALVSDILVEECGHEEIFENLKR